MDKSDIKEEINSITAATGYDGLGIYWCNYIRFFDVFYPLLYWILP